MIVPGVLYQCDCCGWSEVLLPMQSRRCPQCTGLLTPVHEPTTPQPPKNKGTLPDTIRILGIPWRVELVDVIAEDPEDACECDTAACIMRITSNNPPDRQAWFLFWCILYTLSEDMAVGDVAPDTAELNTVRAGLFAAFRDNWPALRRWFGLDGAPPAVVDTDLRLHGMTVRLTRPHLVPGAKGTVLGRAEYQDNAIYVRAVLPPHKAAAAALHELIHFALQPLCRLGVEEAFVRPVALALSGIFFDNPEAMRMLFEEDC